MSGGARWPRGILLLVAWCVPAAVSATQLWLYRSEAVGAPTWLSAFASQLPVWLVWAPLSLAVGFLVRRYPLRRLALVSVAVHGGASLLIGLPYHALLAPWVIRAEGLSIDTVTLRLAILGNWGANAHVTFFAYWAVAGVAAAWIEHERTRHAQGRPRPPALFTDRGPQRSEPGAARVEGVAPGSVRGIGVAGADGRFERLVVRSMGRVRFVEVDEIDWIEAADYCARLHVGDHDYLLRASLSLLEAHLDPIRWLRVHRSAIVRLDHVRELVRDSGGDWYACLDDGTRVRVSRTRRSALQDALGVG